MTWLNELMTLCAGLSIWQGVRWDDRVSIVLAVLPASYPVAIRAYLRYAERRLDRAELGNADLAQRPDLYLVRSVELDCISN
jgi:hypothetical protein